MITLEQHLIIEEQLKKENAKDFVLEVLRQYATTVDNTAVLLSAIPSLAEKQLSIKQERIQQYSFGMDMMMADRHLHPGKYKKNDVNARFTTLYFSCLAHFPLGNANGHSKALQAIFNEFVELLRSRAAFDYLSSSEWDWANSVSNTVGADWLESVIQQHIDQHFLKSEL